MLKLTVDIPFSSYYIRVVMGIKHSNILKFASEYRYMSDVFKFEGTGRYLGREDSSGIPITVISSKAYRKEDDKEIKDLSHVGDTVFFIRDSVTWINIRERLPTESRPRIIFGGRYFGHVQNADVRYIKLCGLSSEARVAAIVKQV